MREFLLDYFDRPEDMLSMIFMKGYQWPFDVNKIYGGSSIIDLLVYQETVLKGRRVYLDFRKNTGNREIAFEDLSDEAYEYLRQADALSGTPIERLRQMNEPAIRFYQDHNVSLYEEMLEIAVCAQHNNGGLSADEYWQTNIRGLFAVVEVCGSHGVARPGGTALNAGQVGAARAAERMSACGGMIRSAECLEAAYQEVDHELNHFTEIIKKPSVSQLSVFYRLRDMLISQKMYLFAMLDYCRSKAGSRGSALYTDKDGTKPNQKCPDIYKCRLDEGRHAGIVQETVMYKGECSARWRPVRPIPETDYFFENQWKLYRERESG